MEIGRYCCKNLNWIIKNYSKLISWSSTTSAVGLIIGGVGGILVIVVMVVIMKRDKVKGECCIEILLKVQLL